MKNYYNRIKDVKDILELDIDSFAAKHCRTFNKAVSKCDLYDYQTILAATLLKSILDGMKEESEEIDEI